MISFLKRLWRDRRGNTLMIAAACLPLFVGAAGLATDTIQWTLWKRELQRAADSAAIAGVYDRQASSGSTSTVSSTVTHDITLNLHTPISLATGYPQLSYPANSGVQTNQVRVILAIQHRLPFSSLFMRTTPTVIARATAASIPGPGDACVEALETSASVTGIINNGTTTISMPNCVMFSNSPSSNSASAGGNSSVTAQSIAAVGGIAQSNNWHVTSYLPYSPAMADPFANVTPSTSAMHCTASALTENTNFATLPAGTNCFASLSVGSNKTLNVPSNFGPIYINGGNATLQGTFNCTGCAIVLTNSNPSSTTIGSITSNAQAHNNITAPTSGTFAGIAVYQDRRAVQNTNKLNGGSGSIITGAAYFPKGTLWINGNGTASALCAMFVARDIVFTGTSGIALRGLNDPLCAASGLPTSSSIAMVRLVA